VRGHLPALGGDHDARWRSIRSPERGRALEGVVHDRLALRRGQHAGAQADERAAGDLEDEVGDVGPRGSILTISPLRSPTSCITEPTAGVGAVDDELLERLVHHAVDLLEDHLGLADGELEALAAHGLDQDAQVQDAAPRDDELVGAAPRLDAQRDVVLELLLEPVADLPARDVLALLPAKGESLMRKVIVSVGSSIVTGGSATRGGPGRRSCRRCRTVLDADDGAQVARLDRSTSTRPRPSKPQQLADLARLAWRPSCS
jgi:hypothetical protein